MERLIDSFNGNIPAINIKIGSVPGFVQEFLIPKGFDIKDSIRMIEEYAEDYSYSLGSLDSVRCLLEDLTNKIRSEKLLVMFNGHKTKDFDIVLKKDDSLLIWLYINENNESS